MPDLKAAPLVEPERQQETAWSVGEQRAWIGRGLPVGVDEHAGVRALLAVRADAAEVTGAGPPQR